MICVKDKYGDLKDYEDSLESAVTLGKWIADKQGKIIEASEFSSQLVVMVK